MKYKRFIDVCGGWSPYQHLMGALAIIAEKHQVSVSNVASAWVLDHQSVRATIIGARLGETEHRADNLRVLSLNLDAEDRASLSEVLTQMAPIPGDCGDEYRKPPFLTASGDLSDHLDPIPPVFAVLPVPGRIGWTRVESQSIWEDKAGFSRAVRTGRRILVSGTTATAPDGQAVCPYDAEGQAVFVFDKILAAIISLGGKATDVVRTRIYLRNAADWEAVSAVHAYYLGTTRPANTLIAGVDLIGRYLVEIEVEAELNTD